MKKSLGFLVCLFLVNPTLLHADVMLPTGLAISGSFLFDTVDSQAVNDVTQSGTFYSSVGGVGGTPTDSRSYTGDSSATPLILADFTHHGGGVIGSGDGFGGTAIVSASSSSGEADARADVDVFPIGVTNTSGSTTFTVTFAVEFAHEVDAAGADAYLYSDLDVELDSVEIFNSTIVSDTLLGNFPAGGFGGPVSASGTYLFDVVLAPGESSVIEFDYTMGKQSPSDVGIIDGSATGSAS